MKLVNMIWILLLVSLLMFIVLIASASRYSVITCTNPYECEDGLSITPDYKTRKNLLSWANTFAWMIIIILPTGVIVSSIQDRK
jgi:hypothetical protein